MDGVFGSRRLEAPRSTRSAKALAVAGVFVGFALRGLRETSRLRDPNASGLQTPPATPCICPIWLDGERTSRKQRIELYLT